MTPAPATSPRRGRGRAHSRLSRRGSGKAAWSTSLRAARPRKRGWSWGDRGRLAAGPITHVTGDDEFPLLAHLHPGMPSSHPLMTFPMPILKSNGTPRSAEASNFVAVLQPADVVDLHRLPRLGHLAGPFLLGDVGQADAVFFSWPTGVGSEMKRGHGRLRHVADGRRLAERSAPLPTVGGATLGVLKPRRHHRDDPRGHATRARHQPDPDPRKRTPRLHREHSRRPKMKEIGGAAERLRRPPQIIMPAGLRPSGPAPASAIDRPHGPSSRPLDRRHQVDERDLTRPRSRRRCPIPAVRDSRDSVQRTAALPPRPDRRGCGGGSTGQKTNSGSSTSGPGWGRLTFQNISGGVGRSSSSDRTRVVPAAARSQSASLPSADEIVRDRRSRGRRGCTLADRDGPGMVDVHPQVRPGIDPGDHPVDRPRQVIQRQANTSRPGCRRPANRRSPRRSIETGTSVVTLFTPRLGSVGATTVALPKDDAARAAAHLDPRGRRSRRHWSAGGGAVGSYGDQRGPGGRRAGADRRGRHG